MENLDDLNPDQKIIRLDDNGISQLAETWKWTMFLSIAGFIFVGLMIIFMVVLLVAKGLLFPPATFLPLLLICLIYIIPIFYLYKFSFFSRQAINQTETRFLSISLKYLKFHYRFMGILLIIGICFYMIFGIIFLVTGKLSQAIH